ncbi:MAG: class II D-tagatose-bisphosphate aldolase, non-catalytic subunit [Desulfobacterales bacterium]|nr:class II D-tagatose-bisphosphate aldolase, non-catalytic subunit [Desulfobacterales bacterium]
MDIATQPRAYLSSIGPRQRSGEPAGIYSVCSSHPLVLEAAFYQAEADKSPLLVESTCNQVNQFGGYSGMTPADFAAYIYRMAEQVQFDPRGLMLGGDHLGPYVWRSEPAESAMEKAETLVSECVFAGYGKIHLDASMPLGNDNGRAISAQTSAERAARLCRAAERAAAQMDSQKDPPLYVIGAEVPTPGGSLAAREDVPVSNPEEVAEFIHACRQIFTESGLEDAWTRVIAVVVQPGIDFGQHWVAPYDRQSAGALSEFHSQLPEAATYEIHATDFQTPQGLSQMVADHFPLLKVGPCLTFAFREAIFALDRIEQEWLGDRKSISPANIRQVLCDVMDVDPGYWHSHHRAESASDWRVLFSYLDRVRYYWARPDLKNALSRLTENLSYEPVPPTLLSQYLPEQYRAVAAHRLAADPASLIHDKVRGALLPYAAACRMTE